MDTLNLFAVKAGFRQGFCKGIEGIDQQIVIAVSDFLPVIPIQFRVLQLLNDFLIEFFAVTAKVFTDNLL